MESLKNFEGEKKYQYEAIIVLSGGLKKIDGEYYPADYTDSDGFGMLGGHMRIEAASELYFHHQAKTFVFTTGSNEKDRIKFGQDVPTQADVYAKAFARRIAELKIKPEYLKNEEKNEKPEAILEDRSATTLANIQEVMQIIKDRGWKKVAILTSEYHRPRTRALYEKVLLEHKDEINCEIIFLSAEEELIRLNPGKYDKDISTAYSTAEAKERIQNEERGLKDINSGKYTMVEFQLLDKKGC